MKYRYLNPKSIESARPKESNYKLSDGHGLYLLITAAGSKLWRYDYRFESKRKTLALGIYPDVSLSLARQRHHNARMMLAKGNDPMAGEKIQITNSLALVTAKWLERQESLWTPGHYKQVQGTLQSAILATLGEKAIGTITPGQLLQELQNKANGGTIATAHRIQGWLGKIWTYANACGYCQSNPTLALSKALPQHLIEHMPTIVEPLGIKELLRAIFARKSLADIGLQVISYTFTRPRELRCAKWPEIDFERKIWTIPADRTKMRRRHLVPLAAQVLILLDELRNIGGGEEWLLPSPYKTGQPITEQTWLRALYATGIKKGNMTIHGFRGIASTLLHESGEWRYDAIETQLAHTTGSNTARSYNHAAYLPERIAMMQWYANHLDEVRNG